MGKRIGFAGVPCEDIMLHIARILKMNGKQVKMADVSATGYLKSALGEDGKHAEEDGPLYLRETEVFSSVFFPEASGDETVLCYLGFRECIYDELDFLVIVTDRMPVNARKTGEMLKGFDTRNAFVIIRDTFVQEYDDSYVLFLLGRTGDGYASVPFSDGDMRVRCRIQNGLPYKVSSLSQEMTAALGALLDHFGERSEEMLKETARKERSGRWGRLWSFGHRYREAVV
ncbi:MAG: hypothetical protein J6Z46_00555 [Lachnospiraceae bacterium]|nr:hypothetical protein [Lachnospiraceae bacterium]